MTITVWIKQEIVLNWSHYKNHLDEIFDITKREPGDLNMMQVNLTPEEYQQIITPKK
jgi:hypothetical protein